MRSQGCTIHQALTTEAAAVVKQAVALAKRRGHAQVTPLHVAHTMLSVSSGLFRAACLQANSHPLQCRALELCFNVALNRLPTTTTSGSMLGSLSVQHHQHPTIANALVAAFKRAQAYQRRGSIENQQQPLLAVKIELEQLIISILDDPSVSRVMKEAGFSSPLVKTKVEQAISVELSSQNQAPNNNKKKSKDTDSNYITTNPTTTNYSNSNSIRSNSPVSMAQVGLKVEKPSLSDQGGSVRKDDALIVIEGLMDKRKRNRVVVGECVSTLGCLVRQVMDKLDKMEVPDGLKQVKFMPLNFTSLCHLSRDEVEQKVWEIKCLVKSCLDDNKGVILYLNDLKWANEYRDGGHSNNVLGDHQQPPRSCYCPIEHMVMEIAKLVSGYAEWGKLWLLGIATFQTYMRCTSGRPSLESIWGLHAITIPAASLGLSLSADSDPTSSLLGKTMDVNGRSWLMLEGGKSDSFLPSHTVNMDHQNTGHIGESATSTSLPSWLQQYKDENTKNSMTNLSTHDQDSGLVKDLGKRWSSVSSFTHIYPPTPFQRTLSFSSISPPSTSNYSYDHHSMRLHTNPHQNLESENFWISESFKKENQPHLAMFPQQRHANNPFVSSSNPTSTPTSTSSSDIMDQIEPQCAIQCYKEYNGENLKALCNALEQKVPHQKDIILEIVSTILHCRSGKATRKGSNPLFNNNENDSIKEETWLFFQGVDIDHAKEKIARELARLIYGSQDKFVPIALSSFASTRVDSLEDSRNKRARDDQSCSYIERFAEAVSHDPHRVFFIEDIDQVDYFSQVGIKKAIERGKLTKYSNEEDVSFEDAIIILSCERFSSRSRACSPSTKNKHDVGGIDIGVGSMVDESPSSSLMSLDLNLSINDDDEDNVIHNNGVGFMDEIGLLATVDRCIMFKC